MGVGERLEVLATRVAGDIQAISLLLDQATGLKPDIKASHLIYH